MYVKYNSIIYLTIYYSITGPDADFHLCKSVKISGVTPGLYEQKCRVKIMNSSGTTLDLCQHEINTSPMVLQRNPVFTQSDRSYMGLGHRGPRFYCYPFYCDFRQVTLLCHAPLTFSMRWEEQHQHPFFGKCYIRAYLLYAIFSISQCYIFTIPYSNQLHKLRSINQVKKKPTKTVRKISVS